jgi:signal transduction histidine kinase
VVQSRLRPLAIVVVTVTAVCLLQIVIWAATSRAYFWPIWTIITLGSGVAIYAWIVIVLERQDLPARFGVRQRHAIQAGVSVGFIVFFVLVWASSSRGYFWPVWPMLVLLVAFVGLLTARVIRSIRAGDLAERIAVLETSRAGAVDQQETELRRIERDLHDGAQARLVALGMSLGMAEQKLASDPVAAQAFLADARRGAREALEELRDLARGIHPPVLADRGLEAAVTALTSRSPLRIKLEVDVNARPSPAVESAAYFVVAEALANIGKHANASHVEIAIHRDGKVLVAEITDDGVGGANRAGPGLSGLARRVEALDGSLEVTSLPDGPTTVRAVIPCGS